MYSDVENGVRFLTELPKEGGNSAYEPSAHIDHENPPVNVVISNAESAITATNEVGILPPVDYSIASGGYVLSNMLYTGPPASVHAQAMCCNRTGNLVYWLEAVTYSGAGALNIATLRVMRSKDFGRTREPAADIDVLSGTTVNGSVGISDTVFVVNPRNLCCNHDATVLVIPFKYGVGISRDLGYTYTWKRLTTASENAFSAGQYICCSESGQYIYVLGRGSSLLYISSDAGVSFTGYPTLLYGALVSSLQAGETIIDADKEVSGLCCSRDGRMVAAVQRVGQQNGARTPNYRGKIYLSFNYGSSFLARTIYDCGMQYTWEFGGITMSESGQNIIVGHNNSLVSPDNQSRLHISTDYGATFQTLANNASTGLPSDIKYAVDRLRSNADCKHIWIQSENSRFMAYSSNYGVSWSQWTLSQDIGARNYDGLCLSAWGDHVYYIYNSSIRRLEMLMLLSGISSASNMGFDTAGSRRMTILADGKVGVGTTAPLSIFDVRGSSTISSGTNGTGSLRIGVGTGVVNDYSWISFIHGNANQSDGNDRARIGAIVENGGGGNLYFTTGTAGAGQAERMRINSSGKVGIGTTSPLSLLDVRGITSIATGSTGVGTFKIGVGTSVPNDNNWIGFVHGTNFADSNDRARIGAIVEEWGGGTLYFATGLSGGQTERMRISKEGKIGINQASPAEILDVVGNIKVAGNILPDTSANLRDLGSSSQRWNTLYCQTTVNVSDRQDKKEIVELDSSQWLDIVTKLHPVSFKYIDNSSDRQHTGFISQQVVDDVGFELADKWGFYVKSGMSKKPPPVEEKVIEVEVSQVAEEEVGVKRKRQDELDIEEVLGEEEFKEGYVEEIVEEPISIEEPSVKPEPPIIVEPERDYYGLRYMELIAPLVSCVQELNKRILLQQEQIQLLSTQIAELKLESAL